MTLKNIFSFLFCCLTFTTSSAIADSISENSLIPFGNGTWVYDSLYNEDFRQPPIAGLFNKEIGQYNNGTQGTHRITQIFTYGSDLELYCRGSGESSSTSPCTGKEMIVPYFPPDGVSKAIAGDSGFHSTAVYANAFASQQDVIIVPVVDGRLDQTGSEDYLSGFNRLSKAEAYELADRVAHKFCADDKVAGVQFDVEPFDITQPGQQYFYSRIAKDFAGKSQPRSDGSDPLHCVDAKYPKGRFFSVFAFAKDVVPPLGDIFTQYNNGMVVDSLYDLGTKPGGEINTPTEFKALVKNEIALMTRASVNQKNVNFQFAIPASASAHEFESRSGVATGYKQIEYVKFSLDAIDESGVRQNAQFKGINIWAWNQKMLWNGNLYTPAQPPEDVLLLLQQRL